MNSRRKLALGVGALVVVMSAMASCSGDGEETTSRTEVKGGEVSGDGTTSTSAPTTTTEAEEPDPQLQIRSGFTSKTNSIGTRNTSAGALITNPAKTKAAYDVRVLFNLKAADGSVIDTDSTGVAYIAPGQTAAVAPLQIGYDKGEPKSLEVVATATFRKDTGRSGASGSLFGEGVALEVVSAVVRQGRYGSEVQGQVRNPSDKNLNGGLWNCVFLSRGNVVGGDSSGIGDPIPAGITVAFSSTLSVDLTADEVVCRAGG
jgi:hypothetical protein